MKVVTTYPLDRFPANLMEIAKTNTSYVLHIWDVCDSDYIYSLQNLQNPPKYIVNDSLNFIQLASGVCYGSNFWLEKKIQNFITIPYDSTLTTDSIFNFVINKKQINRHLCLKLIELFKLSDYKYTWSGISPEFDMSKIIEELNSLGDNFPLSGPHRSAILGSIDIKSNFIERPGNLRNDSSVVHQGLPWWTWSNGINSIVARTAISLITESVRYDHAMTFSEKTLFSVLGLTFPIWIGGYKQAEEWKRTGFDTFDDVINHDYQYFDTLIERCYYAFQYNLELLTNKNKVSLLRKKHKERLMYNRHLILNKQINKFNDLETRLWPEDLQRSILPTLINLFR